ncbi:MAG: hypothetical protein A2252_10750 [Elusimicrobia bacterium RIFOXYA2_FULL_39_19]|nr:MAG: hypothetical protein A2252_10750 [Elusimicrobia bacterium RIFOXYA2_FULL_39_19]
MKKNPAVILLGLLIIITGSTIFSQESKETKLSETTLSNDLSYYNKTASQNKLNDNDRYYILQKIYDKYKNSDVSLISLEAEISKVKPAKKPAQAEATPQTNTSTSETTKVQEPAVAVNSSALPAADPAKENEVPAKTLAESDIKNYKIDQGDILSINVMPAKELSVESVVKPDGTITMQLIGVIKAEGKTVIDLENSISRALSVYVASPKVSIGMKYFNKRQIFILGEIRKPGSYPFKENFRLFDLITAAGGLTTTAGKKNIKVHRGESLERKTIAVNLEEIMATGDFSKDLVLQSGDIVEIPKETKKVSVIGDVRSPGSYEWREDLFILDVVSLAGGPNDTAKMNSVKVFRGTESARQTFEIDLKRIMDGETQLDMRLQSADIVYIPKKPLASNQWFVSNLLPWLSLVSMVFVIITFTNK